MKSTEQMRMGIAKKKVLLDILGSEASRKEFLEKITSKKITLQETYDFLEWLGALLEFGEPAEIDVLREFLGSEQFIAKGNGYLLKFLHENVIYGAEKIKAEILRSTSGGV